MIDQNETGPAVPLTLRVAMCVGLGTALGTSNSAAVGIAVATGLWLALTLGSRRC
jgi:hypothetical protein